MRTKDMADFELDNETATSTSDGEHVLRTGLIFRAGSYPDKSFEISPEEMLEAIDDFKPVDLDVEHAPSIFDGKLGKLEAVMVGDDGWSLIGTVRIPKWLDTNVLADSPRKVSATWNRNTKRLTKLALVRNPRVSDAALMAAFSAHEVAGHTKLEPLVQNVMQGWFEKNTADFVFKTWDGKSTIQSLHDMASRSGAICDESNQSTYANEKAKEAKATEAKAKFVSADEAKAIQQIHDSAVKGGAKCNSMGSCYSAPEDNKENTTMSWKEIKATIMGLPDDFDPSSVKAEEKETKAEAKAPTAEEFAAAVKAALEPAISIKATEKVEIKSETEEEVKNSEPTEKEKELEAEIARLTAEVGETKKKELQFAAEKYVDGKIKEEKEYPAARADAIALYVQLAQDDTASDAKVSFKRGDKDVEASRVELLDAIYSVRKPHNLTIESLSSMGVGVLQTETGDETDYVEEAEKQALAYVARKNKGTK